MLIKFIEIRDTATCVPSIAIKMQAVNKVQERFLYQRCGYPPDGSGVVLMELNNQRASSDPYYWGGRTYPAAHLYILEHFDELNDGDVVDARVFLEEESVPAEPEICVP